MTDAAYRRDADSEEITTSEAAWLTGLPAKTINATIDRGELVKFRARRRGGRKRKRRTLAPADVLYLALRKEIASVLSADAKSDLYDQLAKREWTNTAPRGAGRSATTTAIELAGGLVRIELEATYQQLRRRWLDLAKAKDLVVSEPGVRGGEPVVRGTRVPVYLLAELEAQGATANELLEDFPTLDATKLRSAIAYAKTHPKRGRPRKAPWK